MVFVDPNSLKISPSLPTDSTDLTFDFVGVEDTMDFVYLLGITPVFYIMYRPSTATTTTTGWLELGRTVCQNCFADKPGSSFGRTAVSIKASKRLLSGKYDFMAISDGDWKGTGRDDPTRVGWLTTTVNPNCSDPVALCSPNCISKATCGDCPTKYGCGSVCDTDQCATGCPYSTTSVCIKSETECDTMCQLGNTIEPIKKYLPYIAIGIAALIILPMLLKKRKQITSKTSDIVSSIGNLIKGKEKDEL